MTERSEGTINTSFGEAPCAKPLIGATSGTPASQAARTTEAAPR